MESDLLRLFLIQANKLGMCEGEYAYIALDLYQNDITGTGNNGWKQSKHAAA